MLGRLIDRVFAKFGCEVRRTSQGGVPLHYLDQKRLLANSPVKTIFDVGANVGEVTRIYRGLFDNARIECFEPFGETFQTLAANTHDLTNIRRHQVAVSDEVGEHTFHINDSPRTNSLMSAVAGVDQWVPKHLESKGTVTVPVTTLPTFCEQEGIERIDILKLDIQGAELKALQGATSMLVEKRIALVFCELLLHPIYEGQAFMWDICRFMQDHGYELFNLYDLHHADSGKALWGDALFARQDLVM